MNHPIAPSAWLAEPAELTLTPGDVHVWWVDIGQLAGHEQFLRGMLSSDELGRAARFRFEDDRRRYIAVRASLRHLLGRYLSMPPGRVPFRYGRHGKPELVAWSPEDRLRFNVSHSGNLALCAITRRRAVGVDLERIRRLRGLEAIAERYFTGQEAATLREMPPHRQLEAFFEGWTRKEALVKATGYGLFQALDSFEVSLVAGEQVIDVQAGPGQPRCALWKIVTLSPGHGYAGALAAEGRDWRWTGYQLVKLSPPPVGSGPQ